MTVESTLQTLQQAVDEGNAAKAVDTIVDSAAELSKESRALLPVLDGLDRQKKDDVLAAIIAKTQELRILPLESAIFELRLTFRSGRHGDALRLVEKVLSLANDNVEALRTGGRIGNLSKDDVIALRYWERLARASAGDQEAPLQAARIHLRHQQYTQALNWAQLAARRSDLLEPLQIGVTAGCEVGWPEACDRLLVGLFKIDRTRALKPLARLAEELEAEAAARLLATLQKEFPGDQAVADVSSKAFSEWLVAALEQELASRELEAAAFYRAARSVDPTNSNPQRALDRLCSPSLLATREAFNSRDFLGAVEHGEMASRINPECFEAWQTVGRAQFTRGNIPEASEAFRRCTELDPKDAHSWLTYGLVLNQSGQRRDALCAFQTARSLADGEVKREAEASITALHPLLIKEAKEAASQGNVEVAWQASEAALSIRHDDGSIAALRRNLLRQLQSQIREAWNSGAENCAILCRSYLEKVPGDQYASTVLGRTLMRSRTYGEALPVWESLSKQTPQDAHAFLQIARCCRGLKLKDKGRAAAEMALRLDHSLQEAADLVDHFRSQTSSGGHVANKPASPLSAVAKVMGAPRNRRA